MATNKRQPKTDDVAAVQSVTFDAIMPADLAIRAEEAGIKRASADLRSTFVLAILAGAFISFGAIFATTVSAGSTGLPYGVAKLLTGLAFTLGLILVVCAGAELFTGNNLIVMAWASGRVRTRHMLRNWAVVFAGNFVGAIGTVVLMLLTEQYQSGSGAVGLAALSAAHTKTSLAFVPALTL